MEKTISKSIKIAIVGPESSGKSTLAKKLATYFKADLVTEFARDYLTSTKGLYDKNTLDYILDQQIKLENKAKHELIICDTSCFDIKVWSDFKYGESSDFINERVAQSDYDYTLLLKPDLPYQIDILRENVALENREKLFELFKREIKNSKKPFAIIDGVKEKRTKKAISVIQNHFSF